MILIAARTIGGQPWAKLAIEGCVGGGLYSSVLGSMKVPQDFSSDSPVLLEKEIIEKEMFVTTR